MAFFLFPSSSLSRAQVRKFVMEHGERRGGLGCYGELTEDTADECCVGLDDEVDATALREFLAERKVDFTEFGEDELPDSYKHSLAYQAYIIGKDV